MSNFERIFEELYESVKSRSISMDINKSNHRSIEAMDSNQLIESLQNLPRGPQEEFLLQKKIRPQFGKKGVNNSPIGTHPDFISLEGTGDTLNQYACTLFVDIKGSTRLSLLYSLDFVFIFKNAIIQACIDVIRSFDGYIHRLMGDAVMAFFGGNNTGKEDAIADAINCSITLRAILEGSIKPWMENEGLDSKDFGFRVGCDFGDDNEILWGSFGYQNVGEVSATGLPVDMASKLQGLAGKNQTMLGQGLLDFINWPNKYSKIKTRGKEEESLPVVIPNITDSEGSPLNYKMKQLDYDRSLEFSALPRSYREKIGGSLVKEHSEISYKCFAIIDGDRKEYISATRFLAPNVSLIFEVSSGTKNRLSFPLNVVFKKTNHGPETPENERDLEQEPVVKALHKKRISQYNKSYAAFSKVELPESTLYRGLHTMKCEVFDSKGALLFRDWIGVMIK
ncbi:MAG: adenylate/guanylate cyclase domain-containing protein [Idiomarina sp.]|nr:adenylate/guanylate cyclase domain-containing protein [Idiomarina sp.]